MMRAEHWVVRESRMVEMEVVSPWIRYWGRGEEEGGEKEEATRGPPGREELSEGPYCDTRQLRLDSSARDTHLVVVVVVDSVVQRPITERKPSSPDTAISKRAVPRSKRQSSPNKRSTPSSKASPRKRCANDDDPRYAAAERLARRGGAGGASCERVSGLRAKGG